MENEICTRCGAKAVVPYLCKDCLEDHKTIIGEVK